MSRRHRFVAASVLVVSVVAHVSAVGAGRQAVAPEPTGIRTQEAGDKRWPAITVEPFTNISRDPADDWLGDGIAATVAADLSAQGMSVVGSDDSGTGAPWAVVGGYQRLGDRLRITAQLVDVATGAVRHAIRVDGAVDDIFILQDRIVAELTSNLDRTGAVVPPAGTAERAVGSPVARAPSDVTDGIVIPDPAGAPTADRTGAGGFGIATGAGFLTGRPSVRPARTTSAPRVDGLLDDAVWRDATLITDFVQQAPLDGAPATEETEVYLAYDTEHIYVGIRAHYSDTTLIRANRSDRDQTFSDDTVAVYLDPFLDQQRAYVFSVNGYGVQSDAVLDSQTRGFGPGRGGGGGGGGGGGRPPGSGGGSMGSVPRGGMGASMASAFGGAPLGDTSWDALFDSGGRLVDDGWTAEMAIPFKSLRYPTRGPGELHRWGIQITRMIPGKTESDVWAPVSRDIAGFLPQMGVLDGMTDLSTSKNLEFLPTFTAIKFGSLDATSGTFVDNDTDPEGGLNVKYGVTPNLTADLTFNPDFSQIESDIPQIEVNQRFPLFFPELRPFFLEGQEIFQVPGQVTFVHTRTIADPRYGAKLTGKVGDTTLGVLVANDEGPGRLDDRTAPGFGQTAQVVVGRARYDLYSESYLGAIVTDREFLDGYSRVAGVDGRFRLSPTSSVSFQYAGSQHRDETGAERSGPTYHLAYDSNSRNLSYQASIDSVDPGFRTDTGFVRRVDTRTAQANASYRWWPQNWLINWGPRVSYSRNYDFEGLLQDEQVSAGVLGVLSSNVVGIGMVNRDMERFGGLEFFKTNYYVGAGVTASRKFSLGGFLSWGDQVFYGDAPFLGRGVTATLFATLRPMSRLNADLALITSRLRDPVTRDQIFDVKILRALTTYQFTNRLLFRNIVEYNTLSRALAANLLFTYRVNAGTVFFVGYDDHYQQGNLIDNTLFQTSEFQQTNRAFFTKLSYLFRY